MNQESPGFGDTRVPLEIPDAINRETPSIRIGSHDRRRAQACEGRQQKTVAKTGAGDRLGAPAPSREAKPAVSKQRPMARSIVHFPCKDLTGIPYLHSWDLSNLGPKH